MSMDLNFPIVPFINQPNDTELMFTAHYLISIANYDDLSLENKKHLNLDNLLSQAKILNEIEDNEEEEEEEEDGTKLIDLVNNTPNNNLEDIKKEESHKDINNNVNNNNENIDKSKVNVNLTRKETGETNPEKKGQDDNSEVKKFRGRHSVIKSRKTIKIAENMKKNIDEMLNKKKKELEKIDED